MQLPFDPDSHLVKVDATINLMCDDKQRIFLSTSLTFEQKDKEGVFLSIIFTISV